MNFRMSTTCLMLVIVLLFTAGSLSGQAGRKIPKTASSAPIPAPAPEPPAQATPRPKPDFIVKVIADIQPNAFYAFPMPERMHTWALARLRKTPLLDVRDGGQANRRDAIKQARAETDAYVVLLQLEDDDFGRPDIAGRVAAGQVWIMLTVLSPVTGKQKYSRKIVLNEELRKTTTPPSIFRTCHPGIYGNDYFLLEASLKAAEYVMGSFNIPIPPGC